MAVNTLDDYFVVATIDIFSQMLWNGNHFVTFICIPGVIKSATQVMSDLVTQNGRVEKTRLTAKA